MKRRNVHERNPLPWVLGYEKAFHCQFAMNGIPLKKVLRPGPDLQARNDGLIGECSAMDGEHFSKSFSGTIEWNGT
jgi:hypothetical protein